MFLSGKNILKILCTRDYPRNSIYYSQFLNNWSNCCYSHFIDKETKTREIKAFAQE